MSGLTFKIYLDKSVEENASLYFQKLKVLKKKLAGAERTILKMEKKLSRNVHKQEAKKTKQEKVNIQMSWFTKFRWFFTQHGFLLIGAKDAGSNELIIKKHMSENDIVFHTSAPGSPFFILKLDRFYSDNDLKLIKEDIESSAQITACYSKAWSLSLTYTDVFYVRPEQVTKKAKAGEFLSKGSFMIYGKRNFLTVKLELAVGRLSENNEHPELIVFTPDAVSSKCKKYFTLSPGGLKKSDVVKKLLHSLVKKSPQFVVLNREKIPQDRLHDVMLSFVPSGSSSVQT